MAQSFKEFKKQLQLRKEMEETFRELNSNVEILTRRRDEYAKKARDAKRRGDNAQYSTMVALLKNAMFNLAQAQDMIANFTIARDMCEMQQLNSKFVDSLDKVMKNVSKTCKSIHVSNSEKTFMEALYRQNKTSTELRDALRDNNTTFASSVNMISDITDEEVNDLLGVDIEREEAGLDDDLSSLEREFSAAPVAQTEDEPPALQMETEGGGSTFSAPPPTAAAPSGFGDHKPYVPRPEQSEQKEDESPEDKILSGELSGAGEYKFDWDSLPVTRFEDIAGLEDVKEAVRVKVLLPLKNPDAFEGYEKKNGGGMCLYGPPGTGKTMISAAIANEIGAKFCSVKPSDLLHQGSGNTEKAVRALFAQARSFPCAVIYFDEMDSIAPKSTKSQYAKQLRSEFLAQLQGIDSYKKDTGRILFLIAATNKPWDIDSAFLRPGRFGTKVYVGLPDAPAREYMITRRLDKIVRKGVVGITADIDMTDIVERTNGFNGSDIGNLLDRIEEISIIRSIRTGEKYISGADFETALGEIHSSVQPDDIQRLQEWRSENDS